MYFAPTNPSLEFLLEDLMAGMTEQIEDSITNKCLETLLHWQKASTVVDMEMEAGVVLEKAKGKLTVLLERQQAFRQQQGVEVEDVEMRESTLLAMVAEVEPIASRGEVEGEEEVEAETIEINKDIVKDEEKVQQQGTWSSILL
ncbi:hypothetical protein C0989_010823 [Termitomyces sp. Mn162]|nr:hypothetical protein C0989_010823 [Termitomyces sp. Mn162]